MTIQTDENLRLYVEESLEHLADIENDLLTIEAGGADIDEELVNKVFRAAHSIKGGAATFGFNTISGFTHIVETLLDEVRKGQADINKQQVEQAAISPTHAVWAGVFSHVPDLFYLPIIRFTIISKTEEAACIQKV